MPRDVRSLPRGLVVAAFVLLFARIAMQLYEHRHPPIWADLVEWKTPAQAAVILAMEYRPTLYELSASWCQPCQTMRQEVFGDAEAAAIVRSYLPVQVADEDRSPAAAAIRARFPSAGLPTLVITGPQTESPVFLVGYPGRDKTIAFLRSGLTKGAR